MTKITYPDGIAIWKLVFYAPCLVTSIYIAFRHGLMKSSGWIFLTIFAILRIVGAGAQLATIDSHSDTPATIAGITSAIGLSPLLLASLGLIARAFYSILKQPWNMIFSFFLLKIIQLPAAVAMILCIVGATSANNPAQIDSESTVKIGIILYAVVLVALIVLTFGAAIGWRTTGRGEGVLIVSVAFALPFIVVRIIYSLLAVFSHDSTFNIVTGSTTVDLFMDVLPEAVVVVVYLCCGLKIKSIPKSDQSDSARKNMSYRLGRGDFGTGKLGILSLGAAVIQAANRKMGGDNNTQDNGIQDMHHEKPTHRGPGAAWNAPVGAV